MGEGSWVPIKHKVAWAQTTSIASGILIHPAIWPQQMWAENSGLCPFWGGELIPHLTHCGHSRALPASQVSSSSFQPFGHYTPKLRTGQERQTDRRDRQDRQQRSDSIMLSYRCLSVLCDCLSCPVRNVGVLWPNGWTDEAANRFTNCRTKLNSP